MATNRRLQRSIRPLRSEYRVIRDRDTGRIVFLPYNETSLWDIFEFCTNIATTAIWTLWVCRMVPFVNSNWPAAGLLWAALAFWQNDSVTRWPLRTITWLIFWGVLAFNH